MIRAFDVIEMAHVKLHVKMTRQSGKIPAQYYNLVVQKPEPVHVGVQMDDNGSRAMSGAIKVPAPELLQAVDAGRNTELCEISFLAV